MSHKPIIEIRGLSNYLGNRFVHCNLDLDIYPQEIVAVIGASGCGKTTLLHSILKLNTPQDGFIRVLDQDVLSASREALQKIRESWGVLFQSCALFSSLTVLDNVLFPLREFTHLSRPEQEKLAKLKIALVGLEPEVAQKYPAEISGGMEKRVALARAMVMDPQLLFLDEPTAGLDPKSAGGIDELILNLRSHLNITIWVITHDLDSLWKIADRVIFLGEGRVLAAEPMQKLIHNPHPFIQDYFRGDRGERHRG